MIGEETTLAQLDVESFLKNPIQVEVSKLHVKTLKM